jgi:hypothetical protein
MQQGYQQAPSKSNVCKVNLPRLKPANLSTTSNRRITSLALPWGAGSGSGEGKLDHNGGTTEPSDMSLADGERDHDDAGDPLPSWSDGELDYDGAIDDVKVDCTRSGGGE